MEPLVISWVKSTTALKGLLGKVKDKGKEKSPALAAASPASVFSGSGSGESKSQMLLGMLKKETAPAPAPTIPLPPGATLMSSPSDIPSNNAGKKLMGMLQKQKSTNSNTPPAATPEEKEEISAVKTPTESESKLDPLKLGLMSPSDFMNM